MLLAAVHAISSPLPSVVIPAVASARSPLPAPSQVGPRDTLDLNQKQGIPAILPLFQAELPPIEVVKNGNFTYYRNAYGVQVTQVQYADGNYFYTLSDKGQAIMLRQHNGKRDTLNFSDMNFNIPSPSKIPNVFFHITGSLEPQMTFADNHDILIHLPQGETLRLDAKDGQTVVSGPFEIDFVPTEAGENFDVRYIGTESYKRYRSKGDTVIW